MNFKYKRSDYRGFTIKFGQYRLEYVSRKYLPITLALSKGGGRIHIWRAGL